MLTYHIEIKISEDGTLTIKGLPFRAGEKVDVIVLGKKHKRQNSVHYSLRGKPFRFIDPFESIAEDDWEVLK